MGLEYVFAAASIVCAGLAIRASSSKYDNGGRLLVGIVLSPAFAAASVIIHIKG